MLHWWAGELRRLLGALLVHVPPTGRRLRCRRLLLRWAGELTDLLGSFLVTGRAG